MVGRLIIKQLQYWMILIISNSFKIMFKDKVEFLLFRNNCAKWRKVWRGDKMNDYLQSILKQKVRNKYIEWGKTNNKFVHFKLFPVWIRSMNKQTILCNNYVWIIYSPLYLFFTSKGSILNIVGLMIFCVCLRQI